MVDHSKGHPIMKATFATVALAATLLFASQASQAETLVQQSALPAGSTTLFNAVGTVNNGNQKARLEASGQTTVQGGNPGNGWLTRVERSWEVIWGNSTGTVTFNVFGSNDWTGTPAMTMSQTPTFAPGYVLEGLDIGARLAVTGSSVTIAKVMFNDGTGFVDVPTADATYNTNAFFNNYYQLNGTLGDFTLRGTTVFPTGTTTGDSMRFFVSGFQALAVPEADTGATLLAGLGVLVAVARRKRRA
jgi:hypothetical protein